MDAWQITFLALAIAAALGVVIVLAWDEFDWRRKHGKRGE